MEDDNANPRAGLFLKSAGSVNAIVFSLIRTTHQSGWLHLSSILPIPAGGDKIVRFIKRVHQQAALSLATRQCDPLLFYRSIAGVNSLVKPAI